MQRYLGALLGWLTGHIMTEDQAITGNVLARKVYENLPDAGVVSRAVNHAMRDVFHLDASETGIITACAMTLIMGGRRSFFWGLRSIWRAITLV